MKLRIILIMLTVLFFSAGCGDTYDETYLTEAKIVSIEGEVIEQGQDVSFFKPRFDSSKLDMTLKYSIGKFKYVEDVELSYGQLVAASQDGYLLPIRIRYSRDSMTSKYMYVYVGEDQIAFNNPPNYEAFIEVINEIRSLKGKPLVEEVVATEDDKPEPKPKKGTAGFKIGG